MLFIYSSSSSFPLPPVLEAVVSCPRYSLKDAYSTKLAKAEFTIKQLLLPLFKTFPFIVNTIFTLYESSPNQYLKEIGDLKTNKQTNKPSGTTPGDQYKEFHTNLIYF